MKKNQTFQWIKKAEESFLVLKEKFTSWLILTTFNSEKWITLKTNISDRALEACLSQSDNEKHLHSVVFHSWKFSSAELNYKIHNKELLIIVNTFKQWRVYLKRPKHKVQIYSDYKNLLYFMFIKVLIRRQVCWAEELSQYYFWILYWKGSDNAKADALSQWSDYLKNKLTVSRALFSKTKKEDMQYNWQFNFTFKVETTDFKNNIWRQLEDDQVCQEILKNLKDHLSFKKSEGLLLFQKLVYVLTNLWQYLVKEFHTSSMHRHQRMNKTVEKITHTYYFPHLQKRVKNTVWKCDMCHWTKLDQHKSYKLLKSSETLNHPWSSIALDFVVKLLKFKKPMMNIQYDSILVITDWLIKYRYFISYKEVFNAEELAYAFLQVIAVNHRLSDQIILNRDKLFTFWFWKSISDQLEINHKLSTAYHSQIDSQTEWLN